MTVSDKDTALTINLFGLIHVPWKRDMMLKVMLYMAWAAMLTVFFQGVLNRLPFFSDYAEGLIVAAYVVAVLLSFPALINRFCLADYLFYAFNVFYLLSCYVFFPENSSFLDENALNCIFCVFTFYFIGRIIDIDRYFNAFLMLSTGCIVADILYYLVYAQRTRVMEEIMGDNNMYIAYQLMPHLAFVLWAMLEKFRIWKALVFVLGLVFLLSCGSRGAFVCIGFFGIVYFFFYMKFKGAVYVKLGIIGIVALLLSSYESLLLVLARSFTDLKLSTRILEKIVTGELGSDSYRSLLRDKLISVMDSGGHFWGLGAFGCRNYDIIYPHFLPLDFICTYGYFLGYVLLFLLILLIGMAFWLSRGTKRQIFIIYLFSIAFIKLLLSNTFLLEPYFYMLIGACAGEVIYWHPHLSQTDHDKERVDSTLIPVETA